MQTRKLLAAMTATALLAPGGTGSASPQDSLEPLVNAPGPAVKFDWPMIQVGTASYEEGPTGVTVIRFGRKVHSAVDVRGTPGTVNIPYMEMLWDYAELDAVVFAGGSWYGLETVTAVASALKDDGVRDGNAFSLEPSIAHSVGSIIFDFAPRRLNEIYPDKRLGQAAFRAARPGWFPTGAVGAGRMARTGAFFGCGSPSGQGGAFRQIGEVKIAVFVVVNSYGVVTDRDGRVAACYSHPDWPEAQKDDLHTRDLLEHFPEMHRAALAGSAPDETDRNSNTTLGLVVTNQRLSPVELKRLAVQVHSSVARAIQPYTTLYDGDVLYAASTAELDDYVMSVPELGVMAGEVMWDAILNAMPPQPEARVPADGPQMDARQTAALAGEYKFSEFVRVRITAEQQQLRARAVGQRDAYAIDRNTETRLLPVEGRIFMIPGRYPLTLAFDGDDRLVINPGPWQQIGRRVGPRS